MSLTQWAEPNRRHVTLPRLPSRCHCPVSSSLKGNVVCRLRCVQEASRARVAATLGQSDRLPSLRPIFRARGPRRHDGGARLWHRAAGKHSDAVSLSSMRMSADNRVSYATRTRSSRSPSSSAHRSPAPPISPHTSPSAPPSSATTLPSSRSSQESITRSATASSPSSSSAPIPAKRMQIRAGARCRHLSANGSRRRMAWRRRTVTLQTRLKASRRISQQENASRRHCENK